MFVIAARYFRHFKIYLEVHGLGFLLVDLATLILFALTINVDKEDLKSADVGK